jgi:hypothetical protein
VFFYLLFASSLSFAISPFPFHHIIWHSLPGRNQLFHNIATCPGQTRICQAPIVKSLLCSRLQHRQNCSVQWLKKIYRRLPDAMETGSPSAATSLHYWKRYIEQQLRINAICLSPMYSRKFTIYPSDSSNVHPQAQYKCHECDL